MNSKQAIKAASAKIGRPVKHSGEVYYTIKVPARESDPDGIRINARANTWAEILEARTMRVARAALRLLGVKNPDIQYRRDGTTVEKLVKAGLSK